MTDPNTTTPATLRADALELLREIAARKRYDPNAKVPWTNNSGSITINLKRELLARVDALLDTAAAAPAVEPIRLVHVALAEDGGNLRWMTGRKPRDCELYMMPDGGRAPAVVYAALGAPVAEQKRDDTGRLTSDYEPTAHEIQVAREAIRREFGNNGTDGYYIRILKAIHGAAPKFDPDEVPTDEPRLDKPAQVGGTRFGKGVKWSTVIGAAQRHFDFMQTPDNEARRIARAAELMAAVRDGAAVSPATADERASIWRLDRDVKESLNAANGTCTVYAEDVRILLAARASQAAAPARIEALRKGLFNARDALRSIYEHGMTSNTPIWQWIGDANRVLNGEQAGARADTRKTCMCSGLGPCERRTDGSCRVAAPTDAPDAATFIREVAAQKPEKPDYWSSCGQCQRNAERAQDLLDAACAQSIDLPDSEGGEA